MSAVRVMQEGVCRHFCQRVECRIYWKYLDDSLFVLDDFGKVLDDSLKIVR